MHLVVKTKIKHLSRPTFTPRPDLYSRKTYIHASADDMVGQFSFQTFYMLHKVIYLLKLITLLPDIARRIPAVKTYNVVAYICDT